MSDRWAAAGARSTSEASGGFGMPRGIGFQPVILPSEDRLEAYPTVSVHLPHA